MSRKMDNGGISEHTQKDPHIMGIIKTNAQMFTARPEANLQLKKNAM
jgi:hypothetical protein